MAMSVFNVEHFSTYREFEQHDESAHSGNHFNEWEDERELNGDIGLIPESSNFAETLSDLSDITDSPPSMTFHKMLDWTTILCGDGIDGFAQEIMPPQFLLNESTDMEQKAPTVCAEPNFDVNDFDLSAYINDTADKNHRKIVKSAGKKIDKVAQQYIVEAKLAENLDTNEDVDVETVDGTSFPVLEATDPLSLLEQFEASEKPLFSCTKNSYQTSSSINDKIELAFPSPIKILEKIPKTPIEIFENEIDSDIKEAGTVFKDDTSLTVTHKTSTVKNELKSGREDMRVKLKEHEPTKCTKNINVQINEENKRHDSNSNTNANNNSSIKSSSSSQIYAKNKHILEALPAELIARINESGKRKPITVIPAIPNRKRGASRALEPLPQINKQRKCASEHVQNDHDYCISSLAYVKEPQKDSGFQSSEEDDRFVIRNQPTVKTADGKLMVSLLKNNTIRGGNQKRKLNLEEYKKRRLINSDTTSQSNSPNSSTCSSPLPEDENSKRIKHQEKLKKMAADLLNTPAKSAKPNDAKPVQTTPQVTEVPVLPPKITPPPDLEVKTYVSIATNTELSTINSSKTILASTQQLEDIKPLLKKVSDKINSNSFITSLIENIPKAKTKTPAYVNPESQEVVPEDKIIHYLPKDRLPAKTCHASCQTDFDLDDVSESRYRRRIDEHKSLSSPSGSSTKSSRRRRRSSSGSSCSSSYSSSSSSSRSYRSRSRSLSPKRRRQFNAERLREVEERRVIYVGRISKNTTKDDLRRRFLRFGSITNVNLYFRDYGDNYGFVTFCKKEDAYEAIEHGNDGNLYPKYDLSFGGRRIFCQTSYSDLDNMREDEYNYATSRTNENSFDALLRDFQEKMRKRKP